MLAKVLQKIRGTTGTPQGDTRILNEECTAI